MLVQSSLWDLQRAIDETSRQGKHTRTFALEVTCIVDCIYVQAQIKAECDRLCISTKEQVIL